MPSNNSGKNLSRKENEVIEQQRRLAEQLARKSNPSKVPAQKPPTKHTRPRPKEESAKSSTASSSGASQTRPTFKRPKSAASVLAAARAKATAKTNDEEKGSISLKPPPVAKVKGDLHESPKVKRKTKTQGELNSSRLASLVENVSSVAKQDSKLGATLPSNITADDFWKNLREWDFVSDLFQQRKQEQQDAATSEPIQRKSIPETFISVRHYVAAWAPLCLAETRAQLLSEVITEVGQNSRRNHFIPVRVETTWKTSKKDRNLHTDLTDVDSCRVQLTVQDRGDARKLQFFTHDICCLVPGEHKDMVERLLRGGQTRINDEESFKKYALIGHTESPRKEINGLIIKVSKRKWAVIGSSDMYLLKIGSNITGLREFTALCSVEVIPLKRFLLGSHLEGSQKGTAEDKNVILSKEVLLKKMGGQDALGKGFTDFAHQKFNPSQLMAISASAQGYGDGGFTLIKGPPGTGKTTTLVAVLNSLHIRQYNKYYEEVRRIASMQSGNRQAALEVARRAKPRLLVCAPSNAAVDNIILKIMEDGFVDGSGQRYNPSMVRVGVGQGMAVKSVALEGKVDQILSENLDLGQLESSISAFRMELQRITADIVRCRKRCHAIASASPWPLGKDWEIRIEEESFDTTGRVYFVNHKEQTTTFECPPPPEPGETQFLARSMPEYRAYMQRIVKSVESYFSVKSNLERSTIVKGNLDSGANHFVVRQSLESHVLNSVHMVMTTLGTAGNRVLEGADKFEVVVIDEAAQSVEPATLSALQLGSRHCVLVGDPQQLPATIFNVSGRNSKYDRSLFQRLEEAGQQVFMLNEQYRMHPKISHFPRNIFYKGTLLDGPNVTQPSYGNPLLQLISSRVPLFQPFTVLDLDSKEERGGTSLSNSAEADLAVHLYSSLKTVTNGLSTQSRVAIITPYSQQANLLRRCFQQALGEDFGRFVEVNTVDAFQGREANIVIFSAVRAAGSHGIGFLSDVRRMNVALTRAKHFLFVIARCKSIVVNPYWRDLVDHARETGAVVEVPIVDGPGKHAFGDVAGWQLEGRKRALPQELVARPTDPRKRSRLC